MLQRYAALFILILIEFQVSGQVKEKIDSVDEKAKRIRTYERIFQFSLFPGISSNGIQSGFYYNKFSLNVFGGLSAGNRFIEVGFISNLNLRASNGIQFAGLANVVGSNAFINLTQSEERALIHDGFESNFIGIQFAGFLNYVRTHASGIQLSGAFNVVGFDFRGIQLAGIGNSAGGYTSGIQLAGLYNYSYDGMGGFQISALVNHTNGQLAGLQLGLINSAKKMLGKNSTPPTRLRSIQLGLFNFSKAMDGFQIGLINFGGSARGIQIGLINFFKKYPSKELVHMGTPIGLLNIGSKGSYFRFYYNELFSTNLEYTTGNCWNCSWVMETEMPIIDKSKVFNQNSLIVGYDYFQQTWGFGYGFQKVHYSKISVAPKLANEKNVTTYGIRFMHLNRELSFDKSFNLLSRLNIDYGFRNPKKPPRKHSRYFFVGVSINYFMYEVENEDIYKVNSFQISSGKVLGLNTKVWPGYAVGVQF